MDGAGTQNANTLHHAWVGVEMQHFIQAGINVMSKQFLLLLTMGLLSALPLTASAFVQLPPEPSAFIVWEGICLDCRNGPTGQAGGGIATGSPSTATAVFGVSQPGNDGNGITNLAGGNLLTFSYTSDFVGTLSSYHVNDQGFTFGTIGPDAGSYALTPVEVLFRVDDEFGDVYRFATATDGTWEFSLENFGNDDFGTQGVFNGPAPVPAPATLALIGLGLAGLGWSRRANLAGAAKA